MGAPGWRRWIVVLAVLHVPILLAGFFGPYDPAAQHRLYPFASPTRLHFVDAGGHVHLRPFFYATGGAADPVAIRWFVHGDRHRLAGLFSSSLHLFGADAQQPVFLLGSDDFGRDQFSRWLAGGQVSLLAGLGAALIAVGLGTLVGAVAGYFGGHIDEVLTRTSELFTALPWMYLLIAVRAALPLRVAPVRAFAICVFVVGAIGWVRPARLVRGLVLSARERSFVWSARGFGATDAYLLRVHILPATYAAILTQAALALPQFVVAEVVLSFLGLGVSEPIPSWGNLLVPLQHYHVLVSCWWMFVPAALSTGVFFVYYRFADAVHARLGPVAL